MRLPGSGVVSERKAGAAAAMLRLTTELTPSQRREQQARVLDIQIAESTEALHELERRRAEL